MDFYSQAMKIQFLEHTSLFFNQETMQYNCVIIFLSVWLTSLKVYIKPFVQTSLLSCYSISAATRTSRKETLRKSKPVSCWVKTQQLFLNSRNVLTGLLNFASIYKENKSRHYKKKEQKTFSDSFKIDYNRNIKNNWKHFSKRT